MALEPRSAGGNLPDHEELLIDYATRLARHTEGRRAVHVHLSRLRSQNRRQNYIRIAANTFRDLVSDHEGQLYQLRNNDIIVIVKNATVAQIDQVILRLRYLFAEDPLVDDEGKEDVKFCTWFDIQKDYGSFMTAMRAIYKSYEDALKAEEEEARQEGRTVVVEEPPRRPLTAATLSQVEDALESTDITTMLRRQTICAILPGKPPSPIFNEVFVSIDDLRQRLTPDVNLVSNRWLFQRMTEVLDKRLLKALPDTERAITLPTSININISTMLSDEFQRFDRQFRIITKKAIIAELQAIDIFGDMGAYLFARDLAHERGYKLCLDGLNHLTLPLIDRDALGLDFLKIYWSQELKEALSSEDGDRIKAKITELGSSRVILCRCDDKAALQMGHKLGIHIYQGRYVEALYAASVR